MMIDKRKSVSSENVKTPFLKMQRRYRKISIIAQNI